MSLKATTKHSFMSYTNLVYHIVFRTYHSESTIVESHERELYAYIYGFCKNNGAKLYRIGGMPDHLHLLVSIPPTFAVAEFMRLLKRASSSWLKGNINFPLFKGWGQSYAAFTYSKNDIPMVKNYIMNQKCHHSSVTYENELREMLESEGVSFDEKFFLKD